ncbi:2-C-methyl-D-erythritol 4-phosphate cytidylyltransferase [Solilutibacter silvestris]|nr:2-C-methyl-D-erythritol 4-phosphate cytidylyltransferase [Lysobacter silvestris]
MERHWCVVPAAGTGQRFGGVVPKQYLQVAGRTILRHTLDALLGHPLIAGVVVVLAAGDPHWPDEADAHGKPAFDKPVLTAIGGDSRAASVLSGLERLPADVGDADLVLVHDAARPNLALSDLDALIAAVRANPQQGGILGAPVRDTLKRAGEKRSIAATEAREQLWRAFTPQMFARGALSSALRSVRSKGEAITDEAMAMELQGAHPLLVEGREDNLKITTPADLVHFEFLLGRRA